MAESIVRKKSFEFALLIIEVYKQLQNEGEDILSKQLLRSGTSIGANVEEAVSGQSRRDFQAKMAIAAKEARETRYWLRLLQESNLTKIDMALPLEKVEELIRLLVSIVKTIDKEKLRTQNSELKTL
jgi:four helix bundle protein